MVFNSKELKYPRSQLWLFIKRILKTLNFSGHKNKEIQGHNMTFIGNIIKRYRGDPDFTDISKSRRISYILDNYKISLLLPVCNPLKAAREK